MPKYKPKPKQTNTMIDKYRKFGKTRVGNNTSLFLEDIDHRGIMAKRFREIYYSICGDLGGVDRLSEAQRQLTRRATLLSLIAESYESGKIMPEGGKFNLREYMAITNTLYRVLGVLGIERRPVDVTEESTTTNLSDYLEKHYD
tara:strand:+ start:1644 stop:2075 length:432 start_codon:yes stop_codon:yes gene_type:complete